MQVESLRAYAAIRAGGDVADILAGSAQRGVRVERIVSRAYSSPPGFWYDQEEDEWVMVFSGSARLEFAAVDTAPETLQLDAGDHVLIPAHTRHRVAWTDPDQDTIWLAVFYRDAADG